MQTKLYEDDMDKVAIGLIWGFQCIYGQTEILNMDVKHIVSAFGRSSVVLRLRLVRPSEERKTQHANSGDDGLLHGTQVLKTLVATCTKRNRKVCANSYFASVGCCEELKRIGIRFIGVVKTAKQVPYG